METKITLPNFCWKILSHCLANTPWANSPKDFYVAGEMEEKEILKVTEPPDGQKSEVDYVQWRDAEIEKTLTNSQIEICKKCLQYAMTKNVLLATKYSGKLIQTLMSE